MLVSLKQKLHARQESIRILISAYNYPYEQFP